MLSNVIRQLLLCWYNCLLVCRCSVCMSATCVPRASGKLWCTRNVTCCCCWEVSRSASRPRCVSSPIWGPGRHPHSPPSADPSGDLGLLYELSLLSPGKENTRMWRVTSVLCMDKTDHTLFFPEWSSWPGNGTERSEDYLCLGLSTGMLQVDLHFHDNMHHFTVCVCEWICNLNVSYRT